MIHFLMYLIDFEKGLAVAGCHCRVPWPMQLINLMTVASLALPVTVLPRSPHAKAGVRGLTERGCPGRGGKKTEDLDMACNVLRCQ